MAISSNNSNPARPYCKEGAQLSDTHLKLIVESAIAPEVARERGYRTITTKAELKRYGFSDGQRITPTLLVALFDATGRYVYCQHRPDTPRIDNKTGKTIKYETPAGARMVIDVHPSLSRKRVSENPNAHLPGEPPKHELVPLVADPAVPLLITEGSRKADSAVSLGLCCVALLGVWNFRGSNEAGGKTALPDWEAIALNDRPVIIAFDSDVMQKREVYSALHRLKSLLESRGAIVRMIYLPAGPHGEKVGLDDFIFASKRAGLSNEQIVTELLNLATDELRPPPADEPQAQQIHIDITGKRLRDLTAEALGAIETANKATPRFFQQGGVLVRLHEEQVSGAPRVEVITPDALRGELDRIADWTATSPQTGGPRQADPPIKVVKDVLALPSYPVPPLDAVVSAPFFTANGELIMEPNYNADARVFLHLDPRLIIPPVSPSPSDAEVVEAKRLILEEVLGDFPFVRKADTAHAVGALLYPAVRKMIDAPSPLHGIEAPKPGSGKGLLISIVTMINAGCPAEVISDSGDEAELRKQITSLLLGGASLVLIDNVRRKVTSGSLAALLTADVWKDRILGISRMVAIPNRTLWFITGNNLSFSDEMVRRTVPVRLDAQVEDPSQRTGFRHADLLPWVRDNRSKLIWALLTLVRNWIAQGRKPFTDRTLGSYERWAQVIGGILGAAGIPGFLEGREDFRRRADEEAGAWARFVEAWYHEHSEAVVTVDGLLDLALAELGSLLDDGKLEGEARDRTLRTRLGRMLSKRRDWVIADHKLVADTIQDPKSRARAGWRLTKPPQPPQSHAREADSSWDVGKADPKHEDSLAKSSTSESPNLSENAPTRDNEVGKANPLNLNGNSDKSQRPNLNPPAGRASAEDREIDRLAAQDAGCGEDDDGDKH